MAEDKRKRTQDDLRAFPMHYRFVSCLSWNPNPGTRPLCAKEVDADFSRGLAELGEALPDPMWSYDPSADDAAIYSRCAAAVPYFLLAATSSSGGHAALFLEGSSGGYVRPDLDPNSRYVALQVL